MIWIVDSVLCAIAVASLILALRVPRGAEESPPKPPAGADEPDDAPGGKRQPKDLLRSQKSQRAGQPVTVPDELSS
jgi:hypothetical protein